MELKVGYIIVWNKYSTLYEFVKEIYDENFFFIDLDIQTNQEPLKYYYSKYDDHWILVTDIFEGLNE